MRVEVEVEVKPTEGTNKVMRALNNFFNFDELTTERFSQITIIKGIIHRSNGLIKLYNALRKQLILDSARYYLKRGASTNMITFYLNKQAAYMGFVSFCSIEYGESPLGSIKVTVYTNNIKEFIDWLTPKTIKGKPVFEAPPPNDP